MPLSVCCLGSILSHRGELNQSFPKQIFVATPIDIALQAFYQGVLAVIVQMWFYMRAVAIIGVARLGSLMSLVPAISGFAAVPLLGEAVPRISKKADLIRGATQLLVDILGKNSKTTVVIIDEVDTDNWEIAGETVTTLGKKE